MKKTLSVLLCAVIVLCFAGCAGDTSREDYGSNSQPDSTDSKSIKGFSGTVTKKWDSVKTDYEKLEEEAEAEIEKGDRVTKESVQSLVDEIEEGLKKLKNGVTDDNEETARKVYKDAHKLKALANRGSNDATRELGRLGDSAKALVKQYYGVYDDDYDTVSGAVETAIGKIRDFTDDIWDAFAKLFE